MPGTPPATTQQGGEVIDHHVVIEAETSEDVSYHFSTNMNAGSSPFYPFASVALIRFVRQIVWNIRSRFDI